MTKTVSHADILRLQDFVRNRIQAVGTGFGLPGRNIEMTDAENLAVAWLLGSLDLLSYLGVDVSGVEVRLDNPSSEPDTEGL